MLLYISNSLSGYNGSGQSGLDTLVALLETEYPTIVCTRESENIVEVLRIFTNKTPSWFDFSFDVSFPKKVSKDFLSHFSSYLVKKLKHKKKQWYLRKEIRVSRTQLTITNSVGSHRLWTRVRESIQNPTKSALIIRESPRHFGENSYYSLNEVIQIIETYDYLIFVSSNCRDEWLRLITFNPDNIFYLPNCCREDQVVEIEKKNKLSVKKKLNISPDFFSIVCVGSLQPRKGQDFLVDIFPKLLISKPSTKLYLVGEKGGDIEWLNLLFQKVSENQLSEYIKYLGPQSNSLEYIYAADLLVLPSRAEAMPRVILEAMALKTPVIASNVDGIPELIEHEESGLLFSIDHPEEFLLTFKTLVSQPKSANFLAKNAQQRYWRKFSRSQQITRYGNAINQMISI